MLSIVITECLELKRLLKESERKPKTKDEVKELLKTLAKIRKLVNAYPKAYTLLTGKNPCSKSYHPGTPNRFVVTVDSLDDLVSFRKTLEAHQLSFSEKRLAVYSKSRICKTCGIEGLFLRSEPSTNGKRHLNMYSVKNGILVLMTLDHIKPVSKGGKNDIENLQTMCEPCNISKGNKE